MEQKNLEIIPLDDQMLASLANRRIRWPDSFDFIKTFDF